MLKRKGKNRPKKSVITNFKTTKYPDTDNLQKA